MPLPSIRLTYLILFLGCASLIIIGLYMQEVMGLIPCALCITQRVFICTVGMIALVGFIHNSAGIGHKIYAVLGALAAVIGGSFSTRQLWLQSLPEDSKPACGPDISYMFENFPVIDALSLLLQGDGNCAEVAWTFLGLSIPGWTLIAFAGLVGFNIWQFLRKPTI